MRKDALKLLFVLAVLTAVMAYFNMAEAGGSDYIIEHGTTKSGVDYYRVQNLSNHWIYCQFEGVEYYFNEFEVGPFEKSRRHGMPREEVVGGCE